MAIEGLRFCDDTSAASWLSSRLTGAFGTVTGTVPAGFQAYVRICHPAEDGRGRRLAWSQVAELTGRVAHPTMQWHAIVGSPDPYRRDGLWRGHPPEEGNLPHDRLRSLCDLLIGHTATPEDCFFCLWEGWGWIHGSPAVGWLHRGRGRWAALRGSRELVPPAFSAAELARPRVRLPHRDCLLLAGALGAAAQIGWRTGGSFMPQSPSIFWPADRAWCAATEIDFDSTLVGGSLELVESILAAPTLDSWPVHAGDSLTADADVINSLA